MLCYLRNGLFGCPWLPWMRQSVSSADWRPRCRAARVAVNKRVANPSINPRVPFGERVEGGVLAKFLLDGRAARMVKKTRNLPHSEPCSGLGRHSFFLRGQPYRRCESVPRPEDGSHRRGGDGVLGVRQPEAE